MPSVNYLKQYNSENIVCQDIFIDKQQIFLFIHGLMGLVLFYGDFSAVNFLKNSAMVYSPDRASSHQLAEIFINRPLQRIEVNIFSDCIK